MADSTVISRIQNRRGLRENLPQPLRPGEIALTSDTQQVWIGGDPAYMPAGVLLYNALNISLAQNILDTVILEVRFNNTFGDTLFSLVRSALVNNASFSLEEGDIIWDSTLRTNPPNTFEGYSIYIAADQSVNVNHTLANIEAAILGTTASTSHISTNYVGDLGLFGGDFDTEGYLNLDTQGQSFAIAELLNRVYGSSTGLATTNLNIEITTSGFGIFAEIDHEHDASDITSGIFDLARLPAGSLERLVIVSNETERFALTTNDIQLGDTVLQEDTEIMYRVIDDAQLSNASGYREYTAARASAVDWANVENKPLTFPPSSHVLATAAGLGAEHTVSGLTIGQVLRATGTTSAAFEPLIASDIPDLNTNKITAGVFDAARLGSGTANSATYLRGDLSWATLNVPALNDVTITGITAGEILQWNGSQWINQTLSEVGLAGDTLSSLNDVTITSAVDNHFLKWDNGLGQWINETPLAGSNADLVVKTTTGGALTALAAGTTSQYLRGDGTWATPPDTNTNDYVDSVSFNTGDGVLTIGRTGALPNLTVDLDGRYSLTSHTHGNITSDGRIGTTASLMIQTTTGGTLTTLAAGTTSQYLRGDGTWDTPPDTNTDTNDYVDSVSFDTGNGVLTVGRTGALPDLTVDLDGRYLEVAGDTMTGTLTSQTVLPVTTEIYNLGSTAARYNETWSVTFNAGGADLAERYEADAVYSEGTVVKIGGEKEITATTSALDRKVFGVISIAPGLALNTSAPVNNMTPFVAIAGRVHVRVIGPVEKGQRLVTSDQIGVATASDDEVSPFAVIGRALENKITDNEGLVLAVVGGR